MCPDIVRACKKIQLKKILEEKKGYGIVIDVSTVRKAF